MEYKQLNSGQPFYIKVLFDFIMAVQLTFWLVL
jgi:hypothetical protein